MKVKIIQIFILIFFMLTLTVFAEETYDIGYKMDIDEEYNITVNETELTGNVDNSDLKVKVMQRINGEQTVIFIGPLGEYGDGRWKYTDFSSIQFLVVLDWANVEDGLTYIVPLDDVIQSTEFQSTNDSQNTDRDNYGVEEYNDEIYSNIQYPNNVFVINDIELKNENNENVNSLKDAKVISKVILSKKTADELPATVFAALYEDDRLLNLKIIDIDINQSIDTQLEYTIDFPISSVNENILLKLMILDETTGLRPYTIPLNLYYGYTINISAVLNQEYTLPIIAKSKAKTFKVSYDENVLNIKDLCKETSGDTIGVGIVNEKITIDDVEEDNFTFTLTANEDYECVNYIVMKAVKTENTIVSIVEITE